VERRLIVFTQPVFVEAAEKIEMGKNRRPTATTTTLSKGTTKSTSRSSSSCHAFPEDLLVSPLEKKINKPAFNITELVENRIWVLRDFLSQQECQRWIEYVEQSAELEKMKQAGNRYYAARECYRFQKQDAVMSHRIYERLLQYTVPPTAPWNDLFPAQQPATCNPNLRLYKYTTGMSFGKHVDESCVVTGVGETKMTVLIYLSTCRGGATSFDINNRKSVAFSPQQGAVLLHVHGDDCLVHEGLPVESGIKYILRTDLVYTKH
jgi:hypothetical protein